MKDGQVVLMAHPYLSYNTKNDTVRIANYTFKFQGTIEYPEKRRVEILNPHHITEPFFISKGSQNIFIDSSSAPHDVLDFGLGINMKDSKTNDEYFFNYLTRFKKVNEIRSRYFAELDRCDSATDFNTMKACVVHADSIRTAMKCTRDSILYDYAIENPNSPLLSWLLLDAVDYNGYKPLYQQAFDRFNNNIPVRYKVYLDSLLTQGKSSAIGSTFPLLQYINSKIRQDFIQSNHYTLVDCWFSKCRPCIAQFKILKDIYLKNVNKGFDMVAISIDRETDIPAYERLLSQNQYPWKQILDMNGEKSAQLNIIKYPSNFLLDQTGKIIAIDVNPYVLDDFLERNLNSKIHNAQ